MAVSINAAEEETVAPRAEASRSRESCRLGGGGYTVTHWVGGRTRQRRKAGKAVEPRLEPGQPPSTPLKVTK